MASIRNIVVVAIMQVAVIVAGVLAAGVCHRLFATQNLPLPTPAAMLYANGVLGFLIPVAWSILAVGLHLKANVSDDVRTLIFWLGVFVLIALAIFCLCADVPPLLQFMFANSHSGVDDAD
jgi:hypothetical protein